MLANPPPPLKDFTDARSDSSGTLENEIEAENEVTAKSEEAEVFIEGVLKKALACHDDWTTGLEVRDELQKDLASRTWEFVVGEDILGNIEEARALLGMHRYDWCQTNLLSLRVVQYTGPKSPGDLYSVKSIPVYVKLFSLGSSTPHEDPSLPGAEIYSMPNTKFIHTWDELIFDAAHKEDLLTIVTNTERLNRKAKSLSMIEDRVVLFFGPPGTGKTSLCQGLAQKVSVRLSSAYTQTKLVEVGAATLLSKYFSESAKMVDEIFRSLARLCATKSECFYFVLIDEVESIAMSREGNQQRGEPQDSLRATNALLTGFDRLKSFPNVLVLCTSNMISSIDAAFLSRCGSNVIAIGIPSASLQYDILKVQLQRLIQEDIITHVTNILPSIELARQENNAGDDAGDGARLLHILKVIEDNMQPPSARLLRQLPLKAITRYLKEKECNLGMTFDYIERLILSMECSFTQEPPAAKDDEGGPEAPDPDDFKTTIHVIENTRKRTFRLFVDGELSQDGVKRVLSCFMGGG